MVEQTTNDIQNKVKALNREKILEVKSNVSALTEQVDQFLSVEVPKYKNLVVDSEKRSYSRYEKFESGILESIKEIENFAKEIEIFANDKYRELAENLSGINEESLEPIRNGFVDLSNVIEDLKINEIPKYKNFIVESETKTDIKLKDFSKQFSDTLTSTITTFENSVDQKIDVLQDSFKEFVEVEYPKYSKLLVDTKIKTEEEVKSIRKNIEEKISEFSVSIESFRSDSLKVSKKVDKNIKESNKNIKDPRIKNNQFVKWRFF